MARDKKRKGREPAVEGSAALAVEGEGAAEERDEAAEEPKVAAAPEPDPNATTKIRVTASETTLASRVADAAAAQLLLFDQLPDDERPRPEDRVLLVGLVWGNKTLIELEQVSKGGNLAVGKLFDLPTTNLGKEFQLVRHVGNELVFTVPADLAAEVHTRAGVKTLAGLSSEQKAQRVDAPFRGYSYTVQNDDRIVVQIGAQLTLISRYTRATRQRDQGFFESIDIPFATTAIIALLALFLFWLMLRITPPSESGLADDMKQNQNRFTKYQVKPPEPQKKFKDLSGVKEGAKAKDKEGKVGKKDATKRDAAPSKKGAPNFDKRAHDLKVINSTPLLAALNKMGMGGGAASDTFGPGGLGTGINNALGGVKSSGGQGDAYGVGGLGSRGTGAGGGGTALGIGGLGTKGSGRGRGGYGEVDLGGRGKDETRFVPGRTIVVGGLPREVINRIIQRHYNEIKYCYEKELAKDPGLYGKVTVLFVIDGNGRVGDALIQQTTMSSEPVESCIINHVKRWQFPKPAGGGTVQVTYPYVFKSTGQ